MFLGETSEEAREDWGGGPQHLRVASANVCTLSHAEAGFDESGPGLCQTGRMAVLQEAFFERQIVLAGIQESRMRCTGVIRGRRYAAYVATAAQRGTHGVQLWVRNDLAKNVVASEALSPRALRLTLRMEQWRGAYMSLSCMPPLKQKSITTRRSSGICCMSS